MNALALFTLAAVAASGVAAALAVAAYVKAEQLADSLYAVEKDAAEERRKFELACAIFDARLTGRPPVAEAVTDSPTEPDACVCPMPPRKGRGAA